MPDTTWPASPMPRNHIILGIGLSGVTKSFIQVMVIMGFGLVIGVRFFTVGHDFYAIGIHYVYSSSDIMLSFLALTGFTAAMFLVAWRVFKKAVVT